MSGSYPFLTAAILQHECKGAALARGGFNSTPDEESTGQMWMVGTSLWYKKMVQNLTQLLPRLYRYIVREKEMTV